MLVDLQSAFDGPRLCALAKAVAEAIGDSRTPVFAVVQVNPLGGPLRELRGWCGAAGEHDHELLPPLWDLEPVVYTKTGYGAATTLPIDELRGFECVYVAGADTDACVLATVLALFDAGVSVYVREDLCFSRGGDALHEAALGILRRQLGSRRVVTRAAGGDTPPPPA